MRVLEELHHRINLVGHPHGEAYDEASRRSEVRRKANRTAWLAHKQADVGQQIDPGAVFFGSFLLIKEMNKKMVTRPASLRQNNRQIGKLQIGNLFHQFTIPPVDFSKLTISINS
jgi:hypothetical protein